MRRFASDLRGTCEANDDQSHQAVSLVQCTMLPHLTPVLIISLAAVLHAVHDGKTISSQNYEELACRGEKALCHTARRK